PVSQAVKSTVDKDYAKAHSLSTRTSLTVLITVYVIYLAILLIYSFYRYARRAFEREVSHKRTLLIGAFVAGAFMLSFATGIDEYVFGSVNAGQKVQWFPMIAAAIGFTIIGLIVGIAYEAGEG